MSEDDNWYTEQRIGLQKLLDVTPDSEAAVRLQLDCAAAVAALTNLSEDAVGDIEAIGAFYDRDEGLYFGALYPRIPATTWLRNAIQSGEFTDGSPEFDDSHICNFFEDFDNDNKTIVWSTAVEVLDTPVDDLDFFFDQFTKNIVDPPLKIACAITTLAVLVEYPLLSHPDGDIFNESIFANSAEFFDALYRIEVGDSNPEETRDALEQFIDGVIFDTPTKELIHSIFRQLGDNNIAKLLSDKRLPVLTKHALAWWTGDVVSEVSGRYADACI